MDLTLKGLYKNSPYRIRQGIGYIYNTLPVSLRYRIRYGKIFWDTYNFLQKSQWWSKEKLEEYQLEQLSKLLNHAYENVPYYKMVFDELGLKPRNIQDFNDLRLLPYLTKQTIQNNLEDLKARNYPESKFKYGTTGGSTGIPLGFYREKGVSEAKEWAFMVTQWNRVGYKFGDKSVVLRGSVVQSANRGKFWEYDPIKNEMILSSYHMTDENLPRYVEKIRSFKPKFIQAYPSAITILARFMKENDITPFSSVKAILCGSENLYRPQRELLEEVFKCRIYSWYGLSEEVALGGECEYSTYYHMFPEYGIVELVNEKGEFVTKDGDKGEIVATGFNNPIFPLIRYRTTDIGILMENKCECGREYPLLEGIEGRLQEIIVTKDNRPITLTAFIFAQHFDAFSRVKQMQLLQEKKGKLVVRIIKEGNFSKNDEEEIFQKMMNSVDNQLDIEFEYVDEIPKTTRGKHRFLIQKLPIDFEYMER